MPKFCIRDENEASLYEIVSGLPFCERLELVEPQCEAFNKSLSGRELPILVVLVSSHRLENWALAAHIFGRPTHHFRQEPFSQVVPHDRRLPPICLTRNRKQLSPGAMAQQ